MKRLVLVLLLALTATAQAHPGTGGCKSVDQGGIKVGNDCQVTVQVFRQHVGAIGAFGLETQYPVGNCLQNGVLGNQTMGCPSTVATPYYNIGLGVQVRVLELTCNYIKAAWDASDTIEFCAADCTSTTCTCAGSARVTIDNSSPTIGTVTAAVNALTTATTGYALAARISAKDDTTTPGSETLGMFCSITYEIP